jgi:hypothetical protein
MMKAITTTTTTSETIIHLDWEEKNLVEQVLGEILDVINNSEGKIDISNTTLIISGSTIKVIDHKETTSSSQIDPTKLF